MSKKWTYITSVTVLLLLMLAGYLLYSRNNTDTFEFEMSTQPIEEVIQEEDTPNNTTEQSQDVDRVVIEEWGIQFALPSTIEKVEYLIEEDSGGDQKAYLWSLPSDARVDGFSADYNKPVPSGGGYKYVEAIYRSTDAVKDSGFEVEGKKIGDYYYYTVWSFSNRASGKGAGTGIYVVNGEDCGDVYALNNRQSAQEQACLEIDMAAFWDLSDALNGVEPTER